MTHTDSLLESRLLLALALGQKCGKSEDQWGQLEGSPGQWHANQYHHT